MSWRIGRWLAAAQARGELAVPPPLRAPRVERVLRLDFDRLLESGA